LLLLGPRETSVLAIRRRLGGTFADLLRSGAHEFAPWPCMVSRLLQGNPAALYDSRLRRLLAKFAAHPQRMHRCEISIESRISRAREKFNGANTTHYTLCADEMHGMLCLPSSDADGETARWKRLSFPAEQSEGKGIQVRELDK
jgi:hypothetical protein